MGAAVGIELAKPVDASDIKEHGSLDVARGEVMRLRHLLGAFAKGAGFAEVVYDASDLVQGNDEAEDFERCVAEVKHIRSALRLSTAGGKRRERASNLPPTLFSFVPKEDENGRSSSSSSSSSSNSDDENESPDPKVDSGSGGAATSSNREQATIFTEGTGAV